MKKTPLTFKYRGTAGLNASTLTHTASTLAGYRKRLSRTLDEGGYDTPEGVLNVPTDKSILEAVHSAVGTLGPLDSLQHVILVGIGGSALGVLAVSKAIQFPKNEHGPSLHVLETINASMLSHIESVIESLSAASEVAVAVVSKSGHTLETIANAEYVFAMLAKKFGDDVAKKRVLVASNLDSALTSTSEELEFATVPIPTKVGGRFSVMSGAGLLPLSLLGIDVKEFLAGATWMRDNILAEDGEGEKDAALQSAAFLYESYKNNLSINCHFMFAPELAALGAWYRQLFAESLGKAKSLEGADVHFGMTPEIAIGSNDLHSVAQLFFGGPQNRATTFVSVGAEKKTYTLPTEHARIFGDIFPEISEAKSHELFSALYDGTKAAYSDAEMPYVEATIDQVSERSLGAFMMWKMLEVMYLAQLIGVNAFDQPEVERYKTHTQALFSS